MPNLEELIKIREEAIKEVSEEIEKVEEFLKKGLLLSPKITNFK